MEAPLTRPPGAGPARGAARRERQPSGARLDDAVEGARELWVGDRRKRDQLRSGRRLFTGRGGVRCGWALHLPRDEEDVPHQCGAEPRIETVANVVFHEAQFLHPAMCRDGDEEDAVAKTNGLGAPRNGATNFVIPEGPNAIDTQLLLGIDALQDAAEDISDGART